MFCFPPAQLGACRKGLKEQLVRVANIKVSYVLEVARLFYLYCLQKP